MDVLNYESIAVKVLKTKSQVPKCVTSDEVILAARPLTFTRPLFVLEGISTRLQQE